MEKASTRTLGVSYASDDSDLPRFIASLPLLDILFRQALRPQPLVPTTNRARQLTQMTGTESYYAMNAQVQDVDVYKEEQVLGFLERVCQAIELSESQHQQAQARYEAVGEWLADADDPLLRGLIIYPQGSIVLGTTVKPLAGDEHDVDTVALLAHGTPQDPPAHVKQLIGRRLGTNGRYAPILEEKRRCWRLNYANEFHMDITPAVRNPDCEMGGELVPDKELRCWKPTNPRGYRSQFERRALLEPRVLAKDIRAYADSVEDFPQRKALKGVLRRIVQLAKRHRDLYFSERGAQDVAPISVILTTLASWSYEWCVQNRLYTTQWSLVIDVIRHMANFITIRRAPNEPMWAVWNETTQGENFTERWNTEPGRAAAFYGWHERFLADILGLREGQGLDQQLKASSASFGESVTQRAVDAWTDSLSVARTRGQLGVSSRQGITLAGAGALTNATPVRRNTFYGAE